MRFMQISFFLTALTLVASALPTIDDHHEMKRGSMRIGTTNQSNKPPGRPAKGKNTHNEHVSRSTTADLTCYDSIWISEKVLQEGIKKVRDMVTRDPETGQALKMTDQAVFPYLNAGKCASVVCEGGTSISWCNDNPHEFPLPSYDNIADGAQTILDGCGSMYGIRGTLDHSDHWRVIVGWDQKC
ncbi:hypothetical protein BJY01DRAFT_248498 [Aspergillus pseudoustus]|uniref:Uncharacterized protein n=1 Tax=Aspergillus pseudoustus TaxID=1810923 RepID=A0ABR4JV86_9EURO